MDYNNTDIIIARATPIGKSALAVIRMSGPALKNILLKIFPKHEFVSQQATLKKIKTLNSRVVLDSCVIIFYQNPKSFTGEDMLEISCHGNDLNVNQIISEFISAGARQAYPGEFSYRAFKNSKIDLLQAESIAAKISCNSNQYGVALQNLENGSTSNKLHELRKKIVHLKSIIEHELDFNEDEITHLSKSQIQKQFKEINQEIIQIIDCSVSLQVMDTGYKVAIVGAPNVGKSTLFNKIVGFDRAIVTPVEGTTRDILEASVQLKGVPFIFYDTAGYRSTTDQIEGLGIKKTMDIIHKANIILMLDPKDPKQKFNFLFNKNKLNQTVIFVKTKCDQKSHPKQNKDEFDISCKNDIGINKLLTEILTTLSIQDFESFNNIALCNQRQIKLLSESQNNLKTILKGLDNNVEMDIIASLSQEVVSLIEEMLGKITSNEILNNIFKGFCVGK